MLFRSTLPRTLIALATVGLILAAACTGTPPPPPASLPIPSRATAHQLADDICGRIDPEILQRVYNGTDPSRSGDLQMIPAYPNYAQGLSHATPFNYTQHVPLFIYGPGFVRPGVYPKHVGLVDIAPTTASLLQFDGFSAPDGVPLDEALLPPEDRVRPKVIVTMVWDSAGMDLLDRWPSAWPYLRSIRDQGAWFPNAFVDASPSNTPPSHATIGTGAYPRRHGLVDEYFRIDGQLTKPLARGTAFLEEPTIADIYDQAMGNEPVVGVLASLSAHVPMMGHGSQWLGGDKDIAVTREPNGAVTGGDETAPQWQLTETMAPWYRFPGYVNDPDLNEVFTRAKEQLDREDGKDDGKWRDHDIEALNGGFDTPARTPWQTAIIKEVVEREGFGADDVPDLLFINYKAIDTMGHMFSADGIELSDTLKVQDANLAVLTDFMDRQVGEGKWALLLTADHGMQRDAATSGAFVLNVSAITARIEEAFGQGPGGPVVEKLRPTEVWFNEGSLEASGFSLEQVARFVMNLTQEQAKGTSAQSEPVPGHEQDKVFAGAFPSTLLDAMPCIPNTYPAGREDVSPPAEHSG